MVTILNLSTFMKNIAIIAALLLVGTSALCQHREGQAEVDYIRPLSDTLEVVSAGGVRVARWDPTVSSWAMPFSIYAENASTGDVVTVRRAQRRDEFLDGFCATPTACCDGQTCWRHRDTTFTVDATKTTSPMDNVFTIATIGSGTGGIMPPCDYLGGENIFFVPLSLGDPLYDVIAHATDGKDADGKLLCVRQCRETQYLLYGTGRFNDFKHYHESKMGYRWCEEDHPATAIARMNNLAPSKPVPPDSWRYTVTISKNPGRICLSHAKHYISSARRTFPLWFTMGYLEYTITTDAYECCNCRESEYNVQISATPLVRAK